MIEIGTLSRDPRQLGEVPSNRVLEVYGGGRTSTEDLFRWATNLDCTIKYQIFLSHMTRTVDLVGFKPPIGFSSCILNLKPTLRPAFQALTS